MYIHSTMWEVSPALREAKKKQFNSLAPSFEGAESIIHEKPDLVLHLRISNVRCDDWGARSLATILRTPGVPTDHGHPFKLECCWEILSFDLEQWHVSSIPGANWIMFFDPLVVKSVVQTAADAHQKGATITYEAIRPFVRDYWNRKHNEWRASHHAYMEKHQAKLFARATMLRRASTFPRLFT